MLTVVTLYLGGVNANRYAKFRRYVVHLMYRCVSETANLKESVMLVTDEYMDGQTDGFGLVGRIWVRISPKGDQALRLRREGDRQTDGRMDLQTYGPTDVQTDVCTNIFPLFSTGLRPLCGRCPKMWLVTLYLGLTVFPE